MTAAVLSRSSAPTLPSVNFGPFKLLEAVPWLVFATGLRYLATNWGVIGILLLAFSVYATLIAFVVCVRRMFIVQNVDKALIGWSVPQQFQAAKMLFLRLLALCSLATLLWLPFFKGDDLIAFLVGPDGIAFDTLDVAFFVKPWCAVCAGLAFLMLLQQDRGEKRVCVAALTEFARRALYLVPALVLMTCFYALFAVVQDFARLHVEAAMRGIVSPPLRNSLFFLFVFSFASVKLWANVAILVFFLRLSYADEAQSQNDESLAPAAVPARIRRHR